MHHLLLGISPVKLGEAPFALAVEDSVQLGPGTLASRSIRAP